MLLCLNVINNKKKTNIKVEYLRFYNLFQSILIIFELLKLFLIVIKPSLFMVNYNELFNELKNKALYLYNY